MDIEIKPFWKSKTLIVNLLTVVLMALGVLDPHVTGVNPVYLTYIVAILNVALRILTKGPVTLSATDGSGAQLGKFRVEIQGDEKVTEEE